MRELLFVVSHYSAIFLLAVLSYIVGRYFTRRLEYNSILEQISFSVTLGLGLIAYLVLFLGLLGLLYPWLLLIVFLGGLSICFAVWPDWRRDLGLTRRESEAPGKHHHWSALVVVVLFILVLSLPFLLFPLYPPIGSDSTSYHLACAKMFVQNHGLVFTPNLRYPVFPLTNNMLFTLALLFYDYVLAQLIEFLMLVTLTASVIAFGKRFFSERAAWWSAAILLSNPLVIWLGRVAYIDMGVTLFATTATYAFWNWVQTRRQHWLVLAAVLCGFAVGTKQTAGFFLGALTLTAFWVSLKTRSYVPPVLFATIALLVPMPWLIRSFYYTGNPVFPLFYERFGRLFGYGQSRPEYYKGMFEAISSSGIGTSLKSLITLPWHLAFNQGVFQVEAFISPIYFFALPLLLVFGIAKARIRGLLALALAYTLFWFYSVQVMRFLVLILPLLSLATAAALDLLLDRLPLLRRWQSYKIITALGFVALISPGYRYAMKTLQEWGPLPVTQEQQGRYISHLLPSYPAYKLLNDLKGRNYSVYAFNDAGMAYFADGLFMGDWFGPAVYTRILDKFSNGQLLYEELKVLKADYLLLRDSPYELKPPDDDFFNSHFKPIIRQKDLMLFELTDKPFQRRNVELLQNPGFEDLNGGWPIGWSFSGNPRVMTPALQRSGESVVVQSGGAGDVLFQRIAVSEGPYLFSCRVRALKPEQKARLQINWSDAQGAVVKEDIEVLGVSSDWKRHELNLVRPPQAVTVVVYASALDPSIVWFDDFSFGTIAYQPLP